MLRTRGHIAHAIDLLVSAQSVWPNGTSLSLERAREKYATDIYGLLVSIFSVNHLYLGLTALSSTRASSLVPRPHPRGWGLAHGIIA